MPSRWHQGSFYALPQSPQLYKQILMAAGMERYFQVARCFRDEDLRADRQPEFTQLDMEMSFINERNIQDIIERLLQYILNKIFNIELQIPFARTTYHEAFSKYGSDKPDFRFELIINDLTELFVDTQLSFLSAILQKEGKVGSLHVKNHQFSRSELKSWVNAAIKNGAKGLIWIRFDENKNPESPIAKYLPDNFFEKTKKLIPDLEASSTLFLISGKYKDAWEQLGRLRLQLANSLNIIPEKPATFFLDYRFSFI